MKSLSAILQVHKLDDVRVALADIGILGMTITEVKGIGRQQGHTETYRGMSYQVDFLPKIQIQIAVCDKDVDKVVHLIMQTAYTGHIGDGKIFITPLERVIRIRTQETDELAL